MTKWWKGAPEIDKHGHRMVEEERKRRGKGNPKEIRNSIKEDEYLKGTGITLTLFFSCLCF